MDVHGKKSEFYVYDPLTDGRIRCLFDDDMLDRVREALTKRVQVGGMTTFAVDSQPQVIRVKTLRVIRVREGTFLERLAAAHRRGTIDLTVGFRSKRRLMRCVMPPVDRVVWDTGVVIGLLEQKSDRFPLIAPFMEDAESGRLEILVPETTVVELQGLKGLREKGVAASETREMIDDFLALPYVVRKPLHSTLADLAGELAVVHGIKRAADAVALAIAVAEDVSLLHTFDGSGKKKG